MLCGVSSSVTGGHNHRHNHNLPQATMPPDGYKGVCAVFRTLVCLGNLVADNCSPSATDVLFHSQRVESTAVVLISTTVPRRGINGVNFRGGNCVNKLGKKKKGKVINAQSKDGQTPTLYL